MASRIISSKSVRRPPPISSPIMSKLAALSTRRGSVPPQGGSYRTVIAAVTRKLQDSHSRGHAEATGRSWPRSPGSATHDAQREDAGDIVAAGSLEADRHLRLALRHRAERNLV